MNRGTTRFSAAPLLLLGAVAVAAVQPGNVSAPTVPIVGQWRLNLSRTHYGTGVDVRRSETFTCDIDRKLVRCVIRSVRQDGRKLTAQFATPTDASPAPVTGIPDIDSVSLSQPIPSLLDATFSFRGKPVFAYRAYRSSDGASLMIVSVDPISHSAMTTVVVYDRQ
ncbi:MAG TPA: hypothetical protein VFV19_04715 [Candidatus Polarisedimenticolaceae bacterium]|nr:hypothetical protein [Candidatus Polarisedimenticolaceae bacterium]